MKNIKNGNLLKLVAFFMIVIIISAIVISTGSFNFNKKDQNTDSSGNNNEHTDNSSNNTQTSAPDTPVDIPKPLYIHPINGLEISEDVSYLIPKCFVIDSSQPIYSLAKSYLTVEIPTENDRSRLLCYIDDVQDLGKIGSIAPTRPNISYINSLFGGILICNSSDAKYLDKDYVFTDFSVDLSANTDSYYNEYNNLVYTNGSLISSALSDNPIAEQKPSTLLPFEYSDTNYVSGVLQAKTVIISPSSTNSTEFIYSSETQKYVLTKNAQSNIDMMTSEKIQYDNLFILFADSTTKETSECTQTIVDTTSGGSGIVICKGKQSTISWHLTSDNSLIFLDESGKKLTVPPGRAYISFVKSSGRNTVKIL